MNKLIKTMQVWLACGGIISAVEAPALANTNVIGEEAKAIYDALEAQEISNSKSVGGLECTRSYGVQFSFENQYSCTLNDQPNSGEIYEALKVLAIRLNPGVIGYTQFMKSIGGLSCEKSLMISFGTIPDYHCQLQ